MQCYSKPQETYATAGRSLHTGQQVCRAQHSRSRHRHPHPAVRPADFWPALSAPATRRPPPSFCSAAEPSSWGSLRSPARSEETSPHPTPPPGALGLTPFSPTSQTGYLVHALQTTLWTFSLLFKSPPGEGGKKNPEEIRVNWKEKKKKFKRVSTAAKKVTY